MLNKDVRDSAAGGASPVFVDRTGRRRRLLRRSGYVVGGFCLLYVGVVGFSLLGGPVSPHTLLPLPGRAEGDTAMAVRGGEDGSARVPPPVAGDTPLTVPRVALPSRSGVAGRAPADSTDRDGDSVPSPSPTTSASGSGPTPSPPGDATPGSDTGGGTGGDTAGSTGGSDAGGDTAGGTDGDTGDNTGDTGDNTGGGTPGGTPGGTGDGAGDGAGGDQSGGDTAGGTDGGAGDNTGDNTGDPAVEIPDPVGSLLDDVLD